MKKILTAAIALMFIFASDVWAHEIYIKKNPTNQNGIEFGVNNASGFVRWRAYVKGLSDNSQGLNTGWKNSGNGWWYYDLSSVSQRVMWRVDGIADQKFRITYWLYRADNSWEYGPQVEVVSDQILPLAWYDNLSDGQVINQSYYNIQVDSYDGLSGIDSIRIYVIVPSGTSLNNWTPSGLANQYYLEFDFETFVHQFNFPASGNYTFTLWAKDNAGNISYEPDGQKRITVNFDQGSTPVDPQPVDPPDITYAQAFSYPLACDHIYRLEPTEQIPVGACYDYQPYGSLFSYSNKIHLGADLNLRGVDDLGEPVYSIANGLIWELGWTSGWGNYLIIQYTALNDRPFKMPDGSKENIVYALYAHLNEIYIINDTGERINREQITASQTRVGQGWQIGTVGDGNGNFSPHLHFEIRKENYSILGFGYWPVDDLTYLDYFVDPQEFIDNNRASDDNFQLKVYVHGYDRDPQQRSYLDLDQNHWLRQGRVSEWPLESVGWSNHFWLTSSANNLKASWHFQLPKSGLWSVYNISPRYYAQAHNVEYSVWHGDNSIENPKSYFADQSNDDQNKEIYLGSYYFEQDLEYKVDISSLTADQPAKNVGIDTLMLIYEADSGSGGDLPPQNQIITIMTDGQIKFTYQGTYNLPQLFCQGAGLVWNNYYLQNGQTQNTVEVNFSDEVICNIKFEDGSWMTDYQGIKPNQHFYVNDLEIKTVKDNGIGGTNLVFNVRLNIDHPQGGNTSNSVGGNPSSGVGGCSVSNGQNAGGLINLLVIMLPALILIIGRRLI